MRPKENMLHAATVPPALQGVDGHAPAEHEPSPVPWCSESAEHFLASWETAWIDLGGEG
jgi:hypothetical protein